jgi:hypothetical protein
MDTDALTRLLVAALKSELESGRALKMRIATDDELDGFKPLPGRCHENAHAWVALHPCYSVVEGWVVIDPAGIFARHSAVTKSEQGPICVTYGKQGQAGELDFIVHQVIWTQEPFNSLPEKVSSPPSFEDLLASAVGTDDEISD